MGCKLADVREWDAKVKELSGEQERDRQNEHRIPKSVGVGHDRS